MRRRIAIAAVVLMALGLSGCGKEGNWFGGADNTVTTTTTKPDGAEQKIVESLSDASMHGRNQLEAIKAQKPAMLLEADESKEIKISGVKRWEVYATSGQPVIKQWDPAWARVLINGMPLMAQVAQGYISAEMAKSIVAALGAHKTTATYNITTQDGSPVNVADGNISNGTVSIVKSPVTTTHTENGIETGTASTPGGAQ